LRSNYSLSSTVGVVLSADQPLKEVAMNINDDFKKGAMVTLGVLVALYLAGLASGVLRRVI
jgi:hypothetical protein